MNKNREEIITHQLNSIEFVQSLKELSEKEWRTQIDHGKWTVAEIIGHFSPWDEFVIHKRLPYLFTKNVLPKAPNSKMMNVKSSSISRAENQLVTIDKFVITRNKLCNTIIETPNIWWEQKFSIGETHLTLYDYLHGLAQHDCHHFKQIKNTLHLLN